MIARYVALFALFAASSSASAAPDLASSITTPSSTPVYQSARYYVGVSNLGNQTASSSQVKIQLPRTNTTPVATMGTVGSYSTSCSLSGGLITCNIGTLKRGKSASIFFDLMLPESTNTLALVATASFNGTDGNPQNDVTTVSPTLSNPSVSFVAPRTMLNSHCTGTNLSSYYECMLFPSSISTHETTFNADHTISFGGGIGPEYTGTWSQLSANHLSFTYFEYGVSIAEFEGYGVSSSCWEGRVDFPTSPTYMSMYKVCTQ